MLRSNPGGLSRVTELAVYTFAAVAYIGVGFVRKEVFAWWSYGAIWFVACAWILPPLMQRVFHRSKTDGEAVSGPQSDGAPHPQ